DENAEPGKTYWYTFTVVLSDMTESAPAGKISCTATDTIAPNIYHTPVNQGYLNNNLVISCTASDNIGIQNVTLYYRTKGSNTWKSIEMLRQNDKFSATIFGSELTLDGIEYYIVASDGYNTISKGSADNPYSIVIKDASSISRLGDVDGDGVVTTKDALMIMQAINGDLLLSDDQFRRADLNSDGTLSSVEALRILQYINGNVSSLEM
ncbi:MAG: dockerin type I repeat-containing protein, partial [Bacilli bacterium]|nr:dockerin type I repeat-containing protein [Bacilli bacterium]